MGVADDKLAVYETLVRYCRAMDRMDAALALDCFEPDASLVYSTLFRGSPAEFVAWLWPVHARMVGHTHAISNVLVEIREDGSAVSESYVAVTLRMQAGDQLVDVMGKGRYLDHWHRSQPGRWRIARRTYISDLGTVVGVGHRDVSAILSPAQAGLTAIAGRRDSDDPSYELFDRVSQRE